LLVVGIGAEDCFFDWEPWSRAKLAGMTTAWIGSVTASSAAAPMRSPTVGEGIFQRTAQLIQLVRERVELRRKRRGVGLSGMIEGAWSRLEHYGCGVF
jgi:hypothetical protein